MWTRVIHPDRDEAVELLLNNGAGRSMLEIMGLTGLRLDASLVRNERAIAATTS